MNIGFFGGSFSPPHFGHLMAACYAQSRFDLDTIIWAPAAKHAFNKSLHSFDKRMQMCKLLLQNNYPFIELSDIESKATLDGKTYNTLNALKQHYPEATSIKLIIGSDILDETSKWYRFDAIEKEFGLCIVPRQNYASMNDIAIPNISSSRIRELIDSKQYDELYALTKPEIVDLYLSAK